MFDFDDAWASFDFGTVTKEELDDFYYNMAHPDSENEDYQYRGGYGRHTDICMKINRSLKPKDFSNFSGLLEKKTLYRSQWTSADQEQFDKLEQKLLSSTKEKRTKVQQQHAFEREENQVAGQRVRVKSSGKLGNCVGGCIGDSAGRGTYPIMLDEPSSGMLPFQTIERSDLEILCRVCEEPSNQRCLRCKQVWYCGKDCQTKDWKSHKKECKPVVKESTTADDTATPEKVIHACAFCQTKATQCCSRCKQVWYCSVNCQRRHWKKEHKLECKKKEVGA